MFRVSYLPSPIGFFLNVFLFKGALCCFPWGRHVYQKRFQPKQTKKTNFLNVNHLTLKDNSIPYSFILFICGGPCHLSRLIQCFGGHYLLQLVYSVMEKKAHLFSFYLFISKVWIITSLNCPFLFQNYIVAPFKVWLGNKNMSCHDSFQ